MRSLIRIKDRGTFQNGLSGLLSRSSAHWPERQEEPVAVAEWTPLTDIGEGDTECRAKTGLPDAKATAREHSLTIASEREFETESFDRFEGEGGREAPVLVLIDVPLDNAIWRRPRRAAYQVNQERITP